MLSLHDCVVWATDHYIDDIAVQESIADAETVQRHLAKYGLETKEPESLDGGRLLRIALKRSKWGDLQMWRATALSEVTFEPLGRTKRGLFSWCAKLVGHYPVAGWLRL